jgi:hypothetical protein
MFCFIIWLPWWVTWLVAILLLFFFPLYFEIILWGVIYDAVYGIKLAGFWGIDYIFTLVCIVLFILSFIIRKRFIIYES